MTHPYESRHPSHNKKILHLSLGTVSALLLNAQRIEDPSALLAPPEVAPEVLEALQHC